MDPDLIPDWSSEEEDTEEEDKEEEDDEDNDERAQGQWQQWMMTGLLQSNQGNHHPCSERIIFRCIIFVDEYNHVLVGNVSIYFIK